MNIKVIKIIFLLLFLSSCSSISSLHKKEDKLRDWKLDVSDCKELRTLEHVAYIVDTLNLYNKNKKFLINKIGYPDTSTVLETLIFNDIEVKNVLFLTYYYDNCSNGIVFYPDYCALVIIIISNKVRSMRIECI